MGRREGGLHGWFKFDGDEVFLMFDEEAGVWREDGGGFGRLLVMLMVLLPSMFSVCRSATLRLLRLLLLMWSSCFSFRAGDAAFDPARLCTSSIACSASYIPA